IAAPASHSTKTPASLTSRVMTEANRTAPDASFQVSLAGTLIARRSVDRWLVLETRCSATVHSQGSKALTFDCLQTGSPPRGLCVMGCNALRLSKFRADSVQPLFSLSGDGQRLQ